MGQDEQDGIDAAVVLRAHQLGSTGLSQEAPAGEHLDVDDQDAKQGESAQRVERMDTGFR